MTYGIGVVCLSKTHRVRRVKYSNQNAPSLLWLKMAAFTVRCGFTKQNPQQQFKIVFVLSMLRICQVKIEFILWDQNFVETDCPAWHDQSPGCPWLPHSTGEQIRQSFSCSKFSDPRVDDNVQDGLLHYQKYSTALLSCAMCGNFLISEP